MYTRIITSVINNIYYTAVVIRKNPDHRHIGARTIYIKYCV